MVQILDHSQLPSSHLYQHGVSLCLALFSPSISFLPNIPPYLHVFPKSPSCPYNIHVIPCLHHVSIIFKSPSPCFNHAPDISMSPSCLHHVPTISMSLPHNVSIMSSSSPSHLLHVSIMTTLSLCPQAPSYPHHLYITPPRCLYHLHVSIMSPLSLCHIPMMCPSFPFISVTFPCLHHVLIISMSPHVSIMPPSYLCYLHVSIMSPSSLCHFPTMSSSCTHYLPVTFFLHVPSYSHF